MSGAAPVRRTVRAIARAQVLFAALTVALIMVLTIVDVVRRATIGRSLPGSVDYAELLMVAAVFLGLAFAQHRREHVAVTLVTDRLPAGVAPWLRLAGIVVAIGLVAWLAFATGQEAVRSLERNEFRFGLVRVPVWPARAVLPIGALALLLQLLLDAADVVRHRAAGSATTAHPDGLAPRGDGSRRRPVA